MDLAWHPHDGGDIPAETVVMLRHAMRVGEELGVSEFLIDARATSDFGAIAGEADGRDIILIVSAERRPRLKRQGRMLVVPVPHLTRITLVRVSLFMALLNDYLPPEERVICVTGSRHSAVLDTLLVINPAIEFPWLRQQSLAPIRELADVRVVQRILEIALRFSEQGREGKSIGTIFVIGDTAELEPHLSQLILNPMEGHARTSRNIQNPRLFETLRELSAVDGAFIVSNDGIVESAGTYLSAPAEGVQVGPGLGARHTAAASLTAHSRSIAVTISASSRVVNVYCRGRSILELE